MFTLADVATAADQPVPRGADDLAMAAAHFDSRRIQPGMLFVALPGARVDGHDFIGDAFARGAAAVLCARPHPDQPLDRQVVTAEPQAAFERLASALRARSSATFVGVTGSNGKTTTKEALAAALGAAGPTLATERSENAEVGVPATLSRLTPAHRYAVVEIGAQVVGEIARLLQLCQARRRHHHLHCRGAPRAVWLNGGHCHGQGGSLRSPSGAWPGHRERRRSLVRRVAAPCARAGGVVRPVGRGGREGRRRTADRSAGDARSHRGRQLSRLR